MFFAFFIFSQTEINPSDWKMTQAKLLYEDNKIQDALEIYLEFHKDYSFDTFLNYRIALCFFRLGNYDKSLEYSEIALKNCKDEVLRKEIIYLKASLYHKLEDFYTAKENLNIIPLGTATVDSNQIKIIIKQINVAEESYKNPVTCDFKAIDIESNINSEYNDIFPVCSRLENMLYFTSDRQIADNQEKNAITNNFPFSVFESKITENDKFGIPVLIDETYASGKNFILGSVSAADMVYFLYKETPEKKDGGDLYTDTKDTDEDFTDPILIESELNTKFLEYSPSYDFINTKLYFVSNNKDINKTKSSIFMSELFKNYFPEPDMLKNVSDDNDQSFVYVHPGGDFMVIAMDGEASMGGYDLFISFNDNGKWSEPKNMGYPINTCSDEMQFCLSSDGKTAYITSNRSGGVGGFDIYTFDMQSVIGENLNLVLDLVIFHGQITDEFGVAVNTEIVITDVSNSKNVKKTSSVSNGYYSFCVKPEGKYNISIKNKLYDEYQEEIDVTNSGGMTFEKNIDLILKQ